MQDSASRWPPRVGDRVGIKGSRLVGIVRAITKGAGDGRRVVVSVRAPDSDDPEDRARLAEAVERAAAVYTLDQLEPA